MQFNFYLRREVSLKWKNLGTILKPNNQILPVMGHADILFFNPLISPDPKLHFHLFPIVVFLFPKNKTSRISPLSLSTKTAMCAITMQSSCACYI